MTLSTLQEYVYAHRSFNSNLHGLSHWQQVEFNGMMLAKETGADTEVVQLFALFHDCKRFNDKYDAMHGSRGAKFAKTCFEEGLLEITPEQFKKLYHACKFHTSQHRSGDATIDTCYDADRLDLGRVELLLNPDKMATSAGAAIAQKSLEDGINPTEMRQWLRRLNP